MVVVGGGARVEREREKERGKKWEREQRNCSEFCCVCIVCLS